jgi:hypothetical protein
MTVGITRISGEAGPKISLRSYVAGDLAERSALLEIALQPWTRGTGAAQVDVIYQDSISIADGANTTLDLYASGSLLDIWLQALTMETLKFLYIKNNSADATLLVGGGASLDLLLFANTSDIVKIPPGGDAILYNDRAGSGILLTTNKNLKLTHDGTGSSAMVVDIIAMGLDAAPV